MRPVNLYATTLWINEDRGIPEQTPGGRSICKAADLWNYLI